MTFINHYDVKKTKVTLTTETFLGNVKHVGYFSNIINAKIAANMLEKESIVDSIKIKANNGFELTWKRP